MRHEIAAGDALTAVEALVIALEALESHIFDSKRGGKEQER